MTFDFFRSIWGFPILDYQCYNQNLLGVRKTKEHDDDDDDGGFPKSLAVQKIEPLTDVGAEE